MRPGSRARGGPDTAFVGRFGAKVVPFPMKPIDPTPQPHGTRSVRFAGGTRGGNDVVQVPWTRR
jgi:hypothetical protein